MKSSSKINRQFENFQALHFSSASGLARQ